MGGRVAKDFWSYVQKERHGKRCWVWTAYRRSKDDQFDDQWNRITPEMMERHNLSLPETLVEAFQTVDSYFNE